MKIAPISPRNIKFIKEGMLKAVESDVGTGQLARLDFGRMAGKTGAGAAQRLSCVDDRLFSV